MSRGLWMLLTLLLSSAAVHADWAECKASTERLPRVARDAADAAEFIERIKDASEVNNLLEDLASRLNRAMTDCDYTPKAVRACANYKTLTQTAGLESSRAMCKEGYELLQPGFCDSCLGK